MERRYGGKTAEERRAERREKLLAAGLELFGTAGYAGTTIEALCAAAGLNPRYFYEEFGSREALLAAVYDHHVESVRARVLAALDEAPTPEPRVRLEAALRAFVRETLADERAARVNYFEIVGVSPALEARRREVLAAYAQLIGAEAEQMGMPAPGGDRRLASVALVGAVDALMIDALVHPRRGAQQRIVATLLELFAPE
jgi:AcrR family transcriptional regulator